MNNYIEAESERIASEILDFVESNRVKSFADVIFTTPGVGVMISRRAMIPEFPLVSHLGGFAIIYIYGSPIWRIGSMQEISIFKPNDPTMAPK